MDGPGHLRDAEPVTGEGWPGGWHVWYVAETGSTNADLLAAAHHGGVPDRTVLRTGHQTAGRGRLDRTWTAPPGANLLVSILFRDTPEDPSELTRRVGLAAVEAVRSVTGREATLKWPNDVLLDDRKLGGILAQRAESGAVVAGLGLNVGWSPDDAADLGDGVRPDVVLQALLSAYDALPERIDDHYRAALSTLGRRVRVELPDGHVVGTATDVDPDGRLVLLDDCALTHRVAVGDVVHLRPA